MFLVRGAGWFLERLDSFKCSVTIFNGSLQNDEDCFQRVLRKFQYGGAVFRDIFNEMGWFSGMISLLFL
jgi:hypothetical protein